jgi:limonene-1,2-epoxide hydrolase
VNDNQPVAGRLDSLFAAIDAKNTDAFLAFLTRDALFRFGSAPAMHGHDAIRAGVDQFFASIAGSSHAINNVLGKDATLVCEGEVTYRRHDGTQLTLPFTDVFELDGPLIAQYKIYLDIAPLYET